jgi:hypothetical protein
MAFVEPIDARKMPNEGVEPINGPHGQHNRPGGLGAPWGDLREAVVGVEGTSEYMSVPKMSDGEGR